MSRQPSFFDRTVKLHTPEQMFRLLEQRTGTAIASGPTGQEAGGVCGSPPVEKTALTWCAPVVDQDGGYIKSTDGAYTVTKSRSMGKWVYTASHHLTPLQGACMSADEAKQVAQSHADSA